MKKINLLKLSTMLAVIPLVPIATFACSKSQSLQKGEDQIPVFESISKITRKGPNVSFSIFGTNLPIESDNYLFVSNNNARWEIEKNSTNKEIKIKSSNCPNNAFTLEVVLKKHWISRLIEIPAIETQPDDSPAFDLSDNVKVSRKNDKTVSFSLKGKNLSTKNNDYEFSPSDKGNWKVNESTSNANLINVEGTNVSDLSFNLTITIKSNKNSKTILIPAYGKYEQFDKSWNDSHHFAYNKGNGKLDFKSYGPMTTPGPGIEKNPNQAIGKIPNQKYLDLMNQSYAITWWNGGAAPSMGTAWILDYKLTDDNSYPLTWYFGTNAHVIDNLRVKNDRVYPGRFGEWSKNPHTNSMTFAANNTWQIQFQSIKEGLKVGDEIGSYNDDPGNWMSEFVDLRKNPGNNKEHEDMFDDTNKAKTIFIGNDFLKSSPKDFSNNQKWQKNEEYADFGVFEVTFESEQQAKKVTKNYYYLPEEKKFNYRQKDYLNNPETKTNDYYITGFPSKRMQSFGETREMYVNITEKQYKEGRRNGNSSGTSPYYNTFKNVYGIMDGAIGMPWFGYSYEVINQKAHQVEGIDYITWGLLYTFDNAAFKPGASGSLAKDENGNVVGVYFAADNTASTGIVQAFYSDGYNYNGHYGQYNIAEYDLIRGGKKDQKELSSFYDGLVAWYGKDPKFKTRLFPNGLTSRY